MILLIKMILITSLWVLGLTIVTQEGMALNNWRSRLTDKDGDAIRTIYEPILVCVWCMPSIHSLIGVAFAIAMKWTPIDWHIILYYPFVVAGSSLVSGMTWTIYELTTSIMEYFKKSERLVYFQLKDRMANYNKSKNRNNANQKRNFERKTTI